MPEFSTTGATNGGRWDRQTFRVSSRTKKHEYEMSYAKIDIRLIRRMPKLEINKVR